MAVDASAGGMVGMGTPEDANIADLPGLASPQPNLSGEVVLDMGSAHMALAVAEGDNLSSEVHLGDMASESQLDVARALSTSMSSGHFAGCQRRALEAYYTDSEIRYCSADSPVAIPEVSLAAVGFGD